MTERLFVPLSTKWYEAFESGEKDVELRCINDNFNLDTVTPGRRAQLCKGYNPANGSLWGTVTDDVYTSNSIGDIANAFDPGRIVPGADREAFILSAIRVLGHCSRYIAFGVDVGAGGDQDGT